MFTPEDLQIIALRAIVNYVHCYFCLWKLEGEIPNRLLWKLFTVYRKYFSVEKFTEYRSILLFDSVFYRMGSLDRKVQEIDLISGPESITLGTKMYSLITAKESKTHIVAYYMDTNNLDVDIYIKECSLTIGSDLIFKLRLCQDCFNTLSNAYYKLNYANRRENITIVQHSRIHHRRFSHFNMYKVWKEGFCVNCKCNYVGEISYRSMHFPRSQPQWLSWFNMADCMCPRTFHTTDFCCYMCFRSTVHKTSVLSKMFSCLAGIID